MAAIGKEAMARLRRALGGTDAEVEAFVEVLGLSFMASLPEGEALRFERQVTFTAQAAEDLGDDATPEQIRDRARELAKRPN
jgi:hypothetical protein